MTAAEVKQLGLTRSQEREADKAWRENPAGVEQCVADAVALDRRGTPGALFMTMIRSGQHLTNGNDKKPGKRVTGWRWVRGSHSGMYVKDRKGTDPLPNGYA